MSWSIGNNYSFLQRKIIPTFIYILIFREFFEMAVGEGDEETLRDVIAAFQERMSARMAELDPEAPALIERADEISNQLRAGG